MRNRAKCKLCNEIIESFHQHDYVACKCGEIAVDGGQSYFKCHAKDFNNFLRVDDEGNEKHIIFKDKPSEQEENELIKEKVADELSNTQPMTKAQMLDELQRMILKIEELPPQAMQTPITHYDFVSALMLLSAILRAE